MADKNQAASGASERVISVDLTAADPAKTVERRDSSDIARDVREGAEAPIRTKAEKDLFKRMNRLERNLQKQYDQEKAVREAEWQRERSEFQAKIDRLSLDRSGGDDRADAAHDVAINVLKDKLAAAYEKGDSQASADITLQISKLDAQYWANKAKAAGVAQREPAEATQRTAEVRPAPQTQGKGPTVAGSRFIRANADWWEDPDYAVEVGAANTIYMDLVNSQGFDPKDDETFKEVAKQMKAKFPTLAVKAGRRDPEDDDGESDDEAQNRERQPRRQAAAARIDDRGDAGAQGRSNKRTLSKEEIATMRAIRLDPDNDKDVVHFLKEALALETAEARS